jgi:hypothetical protein
MKNFLVFILILASKHLFACGFYPYGEELRFSFLNPERFGYYSYSEFNYSANSFEPKSVYRDNDIYPNSKLWFDYCHGKAPYQSIDEAVYDLPLEEMNIHSKNEMVKYLFKISDFEAINYLKFAKNCEFFNSWMDDPWERNEVMALPKRTKLLNQAIQLSKNTKNEEIRLRYTFLAIRLAFYNQDFDKIRTLYDSVFKAKTQRNILDYWSLYFRAIAEVDKPLANFYAAQVFVNAPEKRFMIAQYYDSKVPVASVLKYAKTNEERANVYLLGGIKKHDKSLEYLQKVYLYNPKFEGLNFLLLREINKIEDWVFTPYYSLFSPSVETNAFWDAEEISMQNVLRRVATDRAYAAQVLQFVNQVDLTKVIHPEFWKIYKAHLLFITKDYGQSLELIGQMEKSVKKTDEIYKQLQVIKALNMVANQKSGKAIIPDAVKTVILNNKGNKKFLFALGRELEYNGNTTDAALLYSKMDENELNEEHDYYNVAYWKTIKNNGDTYSDFYYDYFDYINVMYTPKQIEDLIQNIKVNAKSKDEFSVWKYSQLKRQVPNLFDLLGTKYIRQNNLPKALASFKKVNSVFWNEKYSAWERNDYDWDGSNIFDANPFYELKYTPDFVPVKDTIRLTKTAITNQLIKYLNKANNVNEKDRDYYYFLVANCYYNMTQYGNSWMMRRYSWTSYGNHSILEDEAEYFQCDLAKKYYRLAKENAVNDKFKALCLRMIARCERNKLEYQFPDRYDSKIENYEDYIFNKNRYYSDLKNNYAGDYQKLTSDCSFFEDYFKARR